MPFTIIRQDITKMETDAIVNAANTDLRMGGGVCGAIFHAAGEKELQDACDEAGPVKTGSAVITPGFQLPAKYIIHAVGPVYYRLNKRKSEKLLCSAYTKALRLALENGCESIAFPLISSGIYGYPKTEALKVATAAIRDFLNGHDMDVYLTVFDRSAFEVSEKLMGKVASYIDEHYVELHQTERRSLLLSEQEALNQPDQCPIPDFQAGQRLASRDQATRSPASGSQKMQSQIPHGQVYQSSAPCARQPVETGLDALIGHLDEPFSDTLLKLIDKKGKTDVEVYKRANIDRKLFSKIRNGKGYTPRKPTILALAVALELTLTETDDLLERAGYALSHASKFDVIVEYFIINGMYDIFEINEVLFKYDQPLLGSC